MVCCFPLTVTDSATVVTLDTVAVRCQRAEFVRRSINSDANGLGDRTGQLFVTNFKDFKVNQRVTLSATTKPGFSLERVISKNGKRLLPDPKPQTQHPNPCTLGLVVVESTILNQISELIRHCPRQFVLVQPNTFEASQQTNFRRNGTRQSGVGDAVPGQARQATDGRRNRTSHAIVVEPQTEQGGIQVFNNHVVELNGKEVASPEFVSGKK
jgi:hypothetical protein